MHPLSMRRLALRRLADDWPLLLSVFVGVALAISLVAAAPVYLKAVERLALDKAIDGLTRPFSNIHTFIFNMPVTQQRVQETEAAVADAIDNNISSIYDSRDRYLTARTWLVGIPRNPLTPRGPDEAPNSRGYLRSFTNIEHNVSFLQGRMGTTELSEGPRGPVVEAIVSAVSADMFRLNVGDLVPMAKSIDDASRVTAEIVGIVEPIDPTADFWQVHAALILDPAPPEPGDDGGAEPEEAESLLPLFVTQDALIESIGSAYPGTLIGSLWFILVDSERLKDWSLPEIRERLQEYENELGRSLPGSEVNTGIHGMVAQFETRRFFSRLPLLLLLTVMVATVLFYLALVASYFVRSRAADTAMLRSRGVGNLQLLRLYSLEGALVTIVAVVLAPFLALGAVALAGKLPYFSDITDGGMLPVELSPVPFVAALGTGLLCLSILVASGLLGARGGVWAQKLSSSRPPTTPFFHRYYFDVGLLVIGGLVFWELNTRGHIVSGGFFKEVEINETLLLAPVLFFVVVALVFIRFFPLVVRYIGGESPAIVHLMVGGVLLVLAPGIAITDIADGNATAWLGPVALLLVFGLLYWGTTLAQQLRYRAAGLTLQSVAIVAFLASRPFDTDELLFVPYVVLFSVVPAQLVFLLLRASMRSVPVWLSVGLLRMARNPLQYTWLVVMLLLATGLGVLSVTVGGSLDRSKRERILYEVAADVRVTGIPSALSRNSDALKSAYLDIPGVTSASLASRYRATVGRTGIEILAVESQEFRYMSWYRDDFSDRTLDEVMATLRAHPVVEPVTIPESAESIGMWLKPADEYPLITARLVVEDGRNQVASLALGNVGPPEWHLVSADIPSRLRHPLRLVSVQIFEPGQGPVGTPGALLLDDIHAAGPDGEALVLEDFEGSIRWLPLTTAPLSTDRVSASVGDVYNGRRAGLFSFGRDTDFGIRGFYRSPTGGPVPVVGSTSFTSATGARIGERFNAEIAGHLVPVVLLDEVDYFPTMSPAGSGFLLADLDSLGKHLRILAPGASFLHPNEAFLTEVPSAGAEVSQAVWVVQRAFGEVQELQSQLDSVRLDPLASAGWRATVFFSLGIVLLAAGLGYVTFLLGVVSRNRGEIGFLQSIGFSRLQVLGLLGFEHLAILAAGLGLGTWAGLRMSSLMVSSVNVTEGGDQVLPPFVLMTDWSMMLPVYGALAALFVGALIVMNLTVARPDLKAISRVEVP